MSNTSNEFINDELKNLFESNTNIFEGGYKDNNSDFTLSDMLGENTEKQPDIQSNQFNTHMFKGGYQDNNSDFTLSDMLGGNTEKQPADQTDQSNNSQIGTVTSDFNPALAVNNIQQSQEFLYYVAIDCNFRSKLHDINKHTHGNIRQQIPSPNQVPVTFNLEDAKMIASKIIKDIDTNGSNNNKHFPIFGAVILKIQTPSNEQHIINVYEDSGKRDYTQIIAENNKHDFVVYNTSAGKRGLLSKNIFDKLQISEALYVVNFTEVSEHMGFALLNMTEMSSSDIMELKKIYTSGLESKFHVLNEQQIHQSGGDFEYKDMYIKEKERYLQLKQIAKQKGYLK